MSKKPSKREHLAHFHIAGFTYYDGVMVYENLKIGTALTLVLEPENGHDPHAVAIYYKDSKLGFVPRANNDIIYKLLKTGVSALDARVQRVNPDEHPEQQVSVVVFIVY